MLKIWGRPTSACTQKALWGLEESDIDYELTLASGTMGPDGHVSKGGTAFGIVDTPEYRAMNPNGTVPTIDDNGFILWESNVIVRYLAMKYAPEKLYDNKIETFSAASRWMDWEQSKFLPEQHNLKDGDKIFTSGMDGVFYEGIPVGEIKKTKSNFEVLLNENPNQIYYVTVVLNNMKNK